MADEPTTSAGNTPAVAPATPPTLAVTPEPLVGDGAETPISLEEAKKLKKEAASLRARLKAFDDAEAQKQLAALSEVEKANKQVADLQQKYETAQKQLIATQVKLAAQSKGIIDPDIAALAVADKLEFGEDGMPSNLEKVLDELIKNKPYLAAKPAEPATTPAQTAQRTPPQFTPNAPGRSQIMQPGQAPQGQPFTPTRLTDVFKRP